MKIYENEKFKVAFEDERNFVVTDKKTGYADCGTLFNGSVVGRTKKARSLAVKAMKELGI